MLHVVQARGSFLIGCFVTKVTDSPWEELVINLPHVVHIGQTVPGICVKVAPNFKITSLVPRGLDHHWGCFLKALCRVPDVLLEGLLFLLLFRPSQANSLRGLHDILIRHDSRSRLHLLSLHAFSRLFGRRRDVNQVVSNASYLLFSRFRRRFLGLLAHFCRAWTLLGRFLTLGFEQRMTADILFASVVLCLQV